VEVRQGKNTKSLTEKKKIAKREEAEEEYYYSCFPFHDFI